MTLNYLSLIRIFSPVMLVAVCSLSWSVSLAGQSRRLPWEADSEEESPLPRIMVYGDISAGKSSFSSWTIHLIPAFRGEELRTAPRWNGSFEFHGVTPGDHRLRVSDARGRVLHEEMVSLYRDGETVSIGMRAEESAQRGQAQTVSLQELQHKSPRKALKEFNAARASLEKQQFARAVDHLKSALAVDPEFVEAHNDLGAAYFLREDYRRSAEHFQKAIDLAPTHKQANENLCLALLKMGRFVEAGQTAGRVVRRGGGSPVAHYAMAVGLIVDGGSRSEALFHLRLVGSHIPNARLLAARILADTGRRTDAARELEAYLRLQNGDARLPQLEEWLTELSQ